MIAAIVVEVATANSYSHVASMVLTTWEGARVRNGTHAPEFNSLSYHGKVKFLDGTPANSSTDGTEEWVVKIFSKQKVEDRWLRRVLGPIGWVHRKEVSLADVACA